MILTPEEARGRWCPFARVMATSGSLAASVNRGGDGSADEVRCLADGCMGWRWAPTLTVNNPTRAIGADGRQPGQRVDRTLGFCGPAGRPW